MKEQNKVELTIESKISNFEALRELIIKKAGDTPTNESEALRKKVFIMLVNTELNFYYSDIMYCINLLANTTTIKSEKILKFHSNNLDKFYKTNFLISKGEIVEQEIGFIDKMVEKITGSKELTEITAILDKAK